jgi:hypothetical protein
MSDPRPRSPLYAQRMPLRVRHGSEELTLADEEALKRLYRTRHLQPTDLVWHPAREQWVRLDAFLFMDTMRAGTATSTPLTSPQSPLY